MMDRLIQDHLPWLYAIVLSVWGGLVQYAGKVRAGDEAWSWGNVALDMIVCSFAGLTAFFLCQWQAVTGWQMAIVVSISAHQGTHAIKMLATIKDRLAQK